MKKTVLLLILILPALVLRSQVRNDSLEYRIRPDSLREGNLFLSINSFSFLRNYEFFNDFQDGYTLYGTQLDPQLVYYPSPKLAVMAGASLRKDFGGRGIYRSYPLFTIKYQSGHSALINGVLEGSIHHRFIEPIYDVERRITDPVEYGTQFVVDKEKLFLDAFISWNNMIYKPSGEQERIFAGISSEITLKGAEKLKVSVPLQLLTFHQGGQIDTVDKPLKTILNGAVGIKATYRLSGFLRSISTENYLVGYKDQSSTSQQPFKDGSGLLLNAGVSSKYGDLFCSYWNGTRYIASAGMPIFQSVSNKIRREGYTERQRELIFFRYAYQKKLTPNFYLDFRVEPVLDLKSPGSKQLDFYHSLFLVYRQDFRLLKKK